MSFSDVEQETIVINTAWGMIDDMVNHANFCLGEKPYVEMNLLPKSATTLRLFNILLADFLSPLSAKGNRDLPFGLPRPPSEAGTSDFTFLFYLKQVCEKPKLGSETAKLQQSVEEFSKWLEASSTVEKVWFPSVQVEADITVERRQWIRMCGDIGKHNVARLEGNAVKLARILRENNVSVEGGRVYELLPEFFEWFHTDVFAYHASTIAEFLNNIRLELFAYLQPEFNRALCGPDVAAGYSFDVPKEIAHELAKAMYWELMNRCNSEPILPKFEVTQYLKMRF